MSAGLSIRADSAAVLLSLVGSVLRETQFEHASATRLRRLTGASAADSGVVTTAAGVAQSFSSGSVGGESISVSEAGTGGIIITTQVRCYAVVCPNYARLCLALYWDIFDGQQCTGMYCKDADTLRRACTLATNQFGSPSQIPFAAVCMNPHAQPLTGRNRHV